MLVAVFLKSNIMFKTKEELLTAILKSLPYSDQITELDFSTEETAIILIWRKSNKFRIGISGEVEEVGNGVLIGSDISILFRELLKRQWVSIQFS